MKNFEARRAFAAKSARATHRREEQDRLFDIVRVGAKLARERFARDASDLKLGRRVRELAQRHLEATWRPQDGRELRVQAMSDAHLFYALAKARRGEYERGSWSSSRLCFLESEALRRLAGVAGTDRQQAAHDREAVIQTRRTR